MSLLDVLRECSVTSMGQTDEVFPESATTWTTAYSGTLVEDGGLRMSNGCEGEDTPQ